MALIMIIEDEKELACVTKSYLEKEGHAVIHCTDGSQAIRYLLTNHVDLLILDIMLPSVDGFTVCETVRKKNNVPIIIVSAMTDEENRIMGLDLGADDYLIKPYSMKELMARVRAQIRRNMGGGHMVELVDGDIRLNLVSRQMFKDNIQIKITPKEFDLLKLFLENHGRVLNKEFILNTVWGVENESEPSTLTVHIKMLRDKIEKDSKHPTRIVTVWGTGYRYEDRR